MVQFALTVAETDMLLVAVPEKALVAVKTNMLAIARMIDFLIIFFNGSPLNPQLIQGSLHTSPVASDTAWRKRFISWGQGQTRFWGGAIQRSTYRHNAGQTLADSC